MKKQIILSAIILTAVLALTPLALATNGSNNIALNLSYMHAVENTLKETSAYDFYSFESSLKEDTITLGVSWIF